VNDNLLVDPVITVRNGTKIRRLSLPGVLAELGRDGVEDFPALRPHQRHPWHAFLCQLAVLALEQAGRNFEGDPLDEAAWRELLRGLTPGFPGDEPWRLVVGDLAKPAFLQPPAPEGSLKEIKLKKDVDYASPFGMDVRVTSKQHGEKDGSPLIPGVESWVLGLLILQTFSGYFGAGNYGIARQNGAYSARHGVSLSVSRRPGPNWLRDCRVLLDSLNSLRQSADYPESGGLRLLWLEPWRGAAAEALPLRKLHPLFVEVCRRIRLIDAGDGGIQYRTVGTDGLRVAAKDYNGAVGDPWLPLRRDTKGVKAYNSRPSYDVAWLVMFDDSAYEPSLLQRFHPGDPEEDVSIVFRVFLRTQGGSEGYHERVVPIQKKGMVNFFRKHRDRAAETAKAMAEAVKTARNKVLKPALLQLMQAARNDLEFKQKETNEWAWRGSDRLEELVDSEFFPHLWRCLDARGEEPLRTAHLAFWLGFLADEARTAFRSACDALPTLSSLRYRARAKAENMLEVGIQKHLRTRSDNDKAS
jgi:CRISPR system Cascade subunit CasA